MTWHFLRDSGRQVYFGKLGLAENARKSLGKCKRRRKEPADRGFPARKRFLRDTVEFWVAE